MTKDSKILDQIQKTMVNNLVNLQSLVLEAQQYLENIPAGISAQLSPIITSFQEYSIKSAENK